VTAPLRGPLDSAALRARMPQLLDRQFREMRVRECLLFDAGDHVELVSTGAEEAVLLAWADLLLDRPVRPQRADRDDIVALLSRHEETLRALDQLDLGDETGSLGDGEALVLRALDDADSPVVRLVNSTLHDAMQNGASDVHMESHPGGMTLRYRLDGVLSKVGEVPGVETAEQMVSRIKVLAELDIAERRVPQDGRFRVSFRGREVDLRVSVMPSVHGEDAVLRILDKQSLSDSMRGLRLESLGLDAAAIGFVRDLASRPHGMLLVTGPTGSGKTTLALMMPIALVLRAGERRLERPMFVHADEICSARRFARLGDEPDTLHRARTRRVVIIDDVIGQKDEAGDLYRVIRHREEQGMPTIITAGFNRGEAASSYGEQFARRMFAGAVHMLGGKR